MKKITKTSFEVNKENLFIDTNHSDYKWLKKHYNDADVSIGEREWVDFQDSFINVAIGKYKLKYIAANVLPEHSTDTIAIVGKAKGKNFEVDKLVLCKFMFDGPDSYEILGVVKKKNTKFNKAGVMVLSQRKL